MGLAVSQSAYLYIPGEQSPAKEKQESSGENQSKGEGQNNFDCTNMIDIPQLECQALVDLYNSTDGANRTTTINWLQNNEACTRYGVSCTNELSGLQTVQHLFLSHNNLIGLIPSNIYDLSNLETLNLSLNGLIFKIPDTIGLLEHLVTLNLGGNNLE